MNICEINSKRKKVAMKNAKRAIKYREACINVLQAIAKGDRLALRNAPEFVKNEKRVVLMAIEKFGCEQLKYAGEQLRMDEEFVLQVVEKYPEGINDVDSLLLIGTSFLRKAHERNNRIVEFLPIFLKEPLAFELGRNDIVNYDDPILDENISW